jgi:hypothetical protein
MTEKSSKLVVRGATALTSPGRSLHDHNMEREIWFERWLGSWMPCHWKGVVVLFAVITATLATYFLAQHAADAMGYRNLADWLIFPILVIGLIALELICRRHSRR